MIENCKLKIENYFCRKNNEIPKKRISNSMILNIHEPIDVITIYKRESAKTAPYKIRWNGRSYLITKVGYHHKVRSGRTVYHIFHVCTDSLAFKMRHDPDTLEWILEEVSDGNPD